MTELRNQQDVPLAAAGVSEHKLLARVHDLDAQSLGCGASGLSC
jgi:hypothetical protein